MKVDRSLGLLGVLLEAATVVAKAWEQVAAEMVLGNNVVTGSVNANKRHWYKAGEALARADRSWLSRLVTRRERPEDFTRTASGNGGYQGRRSVRRTWELNK